MIEQIKLIAKLEPEQKSMVFGMIATFLTKKKIKDYLIKIIAAL